MALQQPTEQFESPIDAASINPGMAVYSRDGTKLGAVRDVWAHIPPYGHVTKSRFGIADYGPIRGTLHLFEGADGYVQVAPRSGMRREGDEDLYIPIEAMYDVVTGQALFVADHSEACQESFRGRPAHLQ